MDIIKIFRFLVFLSFVGIILFVVLLNAQPDINPNVAFFSQPSWVLMGLLFITNPRFFAIYYLCAADPPAGHWLGVVLLGILICPRAWGLFYLPGLSVNVVIRIILVILGLFGDHLEILVANNMKKVMIAIINRAAPNRRDFDF